MALVTEENAAQIEDIQKQLKSIGNEITELRRLTGKVADRIALDNPLNKGTDFASVMKKHKPAWDDQLKVVKKLMKALPGWGSA